MLMQLKNKMTETATPADFTMILDLSDVLQCSSNFSALMLDGKVGAAF